MFKAVIQWFPAMMHVLKGTCSLIVSGGLAYPSFLFLAVEIERLADKDVNKRNDYYPELTDPKLFGIFYVTNRPNIHIY